MTPRIAIVGAGPAGIYAADLLRAQVPEAAIDLYEKLPAPALEQGAAASS